MLNPDPVRPLKGGRKAAAPGPVIQNSASLYGGSAHIDLGNFGRKQHAYYHNEAKLFVPGVTTILKRLDKPALIGWAANMAADYVKEELANRVELDEAGSRKDTVTVSQADVIKITEAARKAHRDFSRKAADVGTQIHACAEKMFRGEMLDLPPDTDCRVHNGVNALREWIAQNDVTPIECERIIHSRKFWYCGMTDLFATVNGRTAVVDFKTGKAIYLEARLQMAAYQIALEEELGENIDDRYAIRLDKTDGIVDPHYFPRSELEINGFLAVRDVHQILTKLENEAA